METQHTTTGSPTRHRGLRAAAAAVAGLALTVTGCSSATPESAVSVAQANVTTKEKALADAQAQATDTAAAFCDAGATYITALDRYGDVLTQTAPTVGDVVTAGDDLTKPAAKATDAASTAVQARDAVVGAEQDLVDAQTALAAAQATASGQPEPEPPTESPSATPAVPEATVLRVQQAEEELASARSGITDETPLADAAEQFTSAAVALEMAWLRLFADAGCLSDEQQVQASAAVSAYTVALQQALADAGFYTGAVDGIYGPQTVSAVQALQEASGLPPTGAMDPATEAALRAVLDAQGSALAQESLVSTAALQQTLALGGYWDGPVDGLWSDELTAAVGAAQTALGVPVTGAVDALTVAAFQQALAAAADAADSPVPTPSESSEG